MVPVIQIISAHSWEHTRSTLTVTQTLKTISLHPAFPRFHTRLQHIQDNWRRLELQSCVSQAVSEDSDTHQNLDLSLPKFVCSVLTHNIKHCPVNSSGVLTKNESIGLCAKNEAHEQKTFSWFHTRFVTTAKEIYTELSHAVKQNAGICVLLQEPHSCKHQGSQQSVVILLNHKFMLLSGKRPLWNHIYGEFAHVTVYANQAHNCTNGYGSGPCPFKSWA